MGSFSTPQTSNLSNCQHQTLVLCSHYPHCKWVECTDSTHYVYGQLCTIDRGRFGLSIAWVPYRSMDGTTSFTFPTGSRNFKGSCGFSFCHVICMAFYLPHNTGAICIWYNFSKYIFSPDLMKQFSSSWCKLVCS